MRQSIAYSTLPGGSGEVWSLVAAWQSRLGLEAFAATMEAVSALQVTGEDGLPGAEMVGVVIEERRFAIVHTRPLDESDIVHELLHVAHPNWPHEVMELWTNRLLELTASTAVGR
jgi:hypothetical protein